MPSLFLIALLSVTPSPPKQWWWLPKQGCHGWGFKIADGPHAGLLRIDPGTKRYPAAPPDVRQAFLGWLNSYRAEHGLPPCGYSQDLEWAALANSAIQATRRASGHYAPNGGWHSVAFWGPTGLEEAIRGWMASPDHNAALLEPSVTMIGVGVIGASWSVNLR